MNSFLVRNLKTGTNYSNPGHRDSIPKTRTVPAKPGQLECSVYGFETDVLRYMKSYLTNRKQKRLKLLVNGKG